MMGSALKRWAEPRTILAVYWSPTQLYNPTVRYFTLSCCVLIALTWFMSDYTSLKRPREGLYRCCSLVSRMCKGILFYKEYKDYSM